MIPARHKSQSAVDPHFFIVECDDGSKTLFSVDQSETFHSESGALLESRSVFLANSGVEQRLTRRIKTKVLEVGFGAGLNFFVTANCAISNATPLEYTSFEIRLLSKELIQELEYDQIVKDRNARKNWLRFYEGLSTANTEGTSAHFGNVQLNLIPRAFHIECLPTEHQFDAVYFDAFSPSTNPELWTREVFIGLHGVLAKDGCLVTYCVKSSVQRDLKSAGFVVRKARGPEGGKREVLIATKIDEV